MKIIISKPPAFIWDKCKEMFSFNEKSTVFTFGDTLYNPGNAAIMDHLLVHEETHANQQSHDDTAAKLWWARYFEDPKFRIDQEVEAYRAQYKFICTKIKDRNARARALHQLASYCSSAMYGNEISYSDAVARIKK
jgi:hypothetical protein